MAKEIWRASCEGCRAIVGATVDSVRRDDEDGTSRFKLTCGRCGKVAVYVRPPVSQAVPKSPIAWKVDCSGCGKRLAVRSDTPFETNGDGASCYQLRCPKCNERHEYVKPQVVATPRRYVSRVGLLIVIWVFAVVPIVSFAASLFRESPSRNQKTTPKDFPPDNPAYTFNINDPREAFKHILVVEGYDFAPKSGNAMIDGDPEVRRQLAYNKLYHKPIRWRLAVESIKADGKMTFADVSWPVTEQEWRKGEPNDSRDCNTMFIVFPNDSFPAVNLGKVKTLRRGDTVIISGVLSGIEMRRGCETVRTRDSSLKYRYFYEATILKASITYDK